MEEIKIKYPPYEAYNNIHKMFKVRGLVADTNVKNTTNAIFNPPAFHSSQDCIKALERYKFLLLSARKENYTLCVGVYNERANGSATNADDIQKMYREIKELRGKDAGAFEFMMVVAGTIKSNTTQKLATLLRDDESDMVGRIVSDTVFSIDILGHCLCKGKHKVLTAEETTKVLVDLRTTKINLPKIRFDDPLNIWMGAKVGEVVQLTTITYSGEVTEHRAVTK